MLQSDQVNIIVHVPGHGARDSCNRLLGWLYCDGRLANAEIIRQGYATHMTRFGPTRFTAMMHQAQQDAQTARAGLWAATRPGHPARRHILPVA